MFFLKPLLGFELLPCWFIGISQGVFFQDNVNGNSVIVYVFVTNSMNVYPGNISGLCII